MKMGKYQLYLVAISQQRWVIKTISQIFLILFLFSLVFNCKKETLKVAPTVTMTPVTNITSVSASTGGNVTADGGASVTARGICWSSTNKTPTTADGNVNSGSGLGSYTGSITGLTPGTTYYVNAYATNSIGTSYSTTSTFTTLAIAPTITTTEVTNITTATATSGGNIPNDGGSPVTSRGVCWSTNQNPTIADSKTTDGTGTGNFTSNLTNLKSGSTYYVRAYATNSISTTYGNQVTMNIISILSVVVTTEISSFTATSISCGGNVTNDGGATITKRGVCWNTKENPTISENRTDDGTGIGHFSSAINGLTPGFTYFIRAYSTNSAGTSYGNQLSIILPKFKNYLIPSYYLKESEIWVDFSKISQDNTVNPNCGTAIADFNGDGYDDVLLSGDGGDGLRHPCRLYLNDGTNEKFLFNNTLIKNNIGPLTARKAIVGDFNGDGKPDVFYADNGEFKSGGSFLFASPSIVLSSPNGYDFKVLDNIPKGFYHGACSGDFDNDGDLDIFLSEGIFLVNDGKGNFTLNNEIFNSNSSGILTCELVDINKDGYLDLIVGGHTMVSWELDKPKIFWGNGINYRIERSTSLPDIPDWEVQADFCFKDIDNDGLIDIIVERSGGAPMANDPTSYDFSKFWVGFRIQILKNVGNNSFVDKTDDFIRDYYSKEIHWMSILRLEDIDKNGKLDMFSSDKGNMNSGVIIRWEQDVDGIFRRK